MADLKAIIDKGGPWEQARIIGDQLLIQGDCRDVMRGMPDGIAQTCVTSPPYFGLRDYGHDRQIGLEETPEDFVARLVDVFREVRRVLRDDGTLWLNLGDSYAANRAYQVPSTKGGPKHGPGQSAGGAASVVPDGLKQKDLIGIPWRVAFALQADGWYLRQEIIWHKPNPMPESVKDRCTKAHEQVFLLTKKARYFFDADAIAEPGEWCGKQLGIVRGKKVRAEAMGRKPSGNEVPGADAMAPHMRNKRSVWTIATQPYSGAHFATMPPELAATCIKAGSKPGDMVLDPFGGAGTTGLVADRLQRNATLIELNPKYFGIAADRIRSEAPLLAASQPAPTSAGPPKPTQEAMDL